MGYKIKDVKTIIVYNQNDYPILYLDKVDPTFELVGKEKINVKFNNRRVFYSFKYGEYSFELDATIEVLI